MCEAVRIRSSGVIVRLYLPRLVRYTTNARIAIPADPSRENGAQDGIAQPSYLRAADGKGRDAGPKAAGAKKCAGREEGGAREKREAQTSAGFLMETDER